jgi:hypothetical protein
MQTQLQLLGNCRVQLLQPWRPVFWLVTNNIAYHKQEGISPSFVLRRTAAPQNKKEHIIACSFVCIKLFL